ncbi:MAG: YegS/Rv2252/BmrU family lipid kinase [Gracilimonas sp.]|nr:YegS/Rv2252/BmrU family lipid kinase [Gracilimonas sp.]
MSETATYCFIINCASNASASETTFRHHEKHIKNKLPDAVFRYIRVDESIQKYVRDNLQKFTHFIACGGDGTVNQVANALADQNKIMGVIPLGSGNDFAQNIGLNGDFDHDFSVLLKENVRIIDSIRANNELFINTYGIGVDGLTNYYASNSKFKSGFLKYFIGGLKALSKAHRFDLDIKIDENARKKLTSIWMIAIANGKTEGGRYKISPNSDSGDGIAEIIVINGISRLRLIVEFLKLSFGISFNQNVVEVYDFKSTLEINISKEVRTHSDGEQMGFQKRYQFKMERASLNVIVK